ncbi:MAG: hypothetical protein GX937_03790 [Lentisphaerae bacterium]|nr:hypothetical protein [Lentisphaerota bacterium]
MATAEMTASRIWHQEKKLGAARHVDAALGSGLFFVRRIVKMTSGVHSIQFMQG